MNKWFPRIGLLGLASCVETHLSEEYLSNHQSKKILANFKRDDESVAFFKSYWLLGMPLCHDVLFHLCYKPSVMEPCLRMQYLRERKAEANFKDTFTYLIMGLILPRTAFAFQLGSLTRNLALNLDIQNEQALNVLENSEIGKVARILMLLAPLAHLF